jgi:prevent-host-death family protein
MASVGIRELKHDTSAILRRVREGREVVDVTHRGRVVARIVPVEAHETSARKMRAYWREIDELAKEVGKHWPKGMTAVEAVRGQRRG